MTERPIKNIPASIRQRLTNCAQQTSRSFQEVLQYYAMERFLFRLSHSAYRDRFVLKGALVFSVWGGPTTRATRDIDLLGYVHNDVQTVVTIMREVAAVSVDPDGLVFDVAKMQGMLIKEDADYSGVRVTFLAYLDRAQVNMQIDIGFGDVLVSTAELSKYTSLLSMEPPLLRTYPRETVVAEKFEAMVKLGLFNSRMKDYYDIWLLSKGFEFSQPLLAEAISQTFKHRGTALTDNPIALSQSFIDDLGKRTQWAAFLTKSKLSDAPTELEEIIQQLRAFLLPVVIATFADDPPLHSWSPNRGWHLSPA